MFFICDFGIVIVFAVHYCDENMLLESWWTVWKLCRFSREFCCSQS